MKSALELLGNTPDIYLSDDYLVIDLEVATNDGQFGNPAIQENELLLACWKQANSNVVQRQWAGEFGQSRLTLDLRECKFVVAHNGKYEAGWLRRIGVPLERLFLYDTQIAEYVLAGRACAKGELSLNAICKRRGYHAKDPIVDHLIKCGVNPSRIPRTWLEQRCVQDVRTTEQVFRAQREDLRAAGKLAVQFTRCLLTPVLADMESSGLALDAERVATEYNAVVEKSVVRGQELDVLTGGINTASGKQVGEFLYGRGPGQLGFAELCDYHGRPKRTDGGKPKTDAKTLAALKATTPEQRSFLTAHKELAKLTSALSKSLNFYDGICKNRGGIFYGQFNQTVTATGRLSSTGVSTEWGSVQFQNQPREYKKLFRAKRDGWLIAEADGAQLEFRIAAHLGNDEQAIRDIEDSDFDAHIVSAAAMAGIAYADMLAKYRAGDAKVKAARQDAKPETFKPLYGGTKGTKQQERWYAEFKRRYPGIAKAQQDWVNEVVLHKRLRTDWGATFEFPTAHMSSSGYVNVTSQVYNYPVQAFATAEIIPIAVVCFWKRVADQGLAEFIRCVNTVHDSIVCELHPDYKQQFIDIAKQAFTTDVYEYLEAFYGITMRVPLGVACKIGEHWGEGKELAWDIYKDGREVDRTK